MGEGFVWLEVELVAGLSVLERNDASKLLYLCNLPALSRILAGGIRMLTARPPRIEDEPKNSSWLWIAWGIPMGVVTDIVGIGGGVLLVPVMVLALKFKMHNAVGTSTAMMIFTSIGGVIGYVVNGLGGYRITDWLYRICACLVMVGSGSY